MSSTSSKLSIDLSAIAHNWQLHSKYVYPSKCSAVVKANGYGLGMIEVSARLYQEGCRDFFVASLQEAKQLQPEIGPDSNIFVLSGVFPGEELECAECGFIPVLVSLSMLERWVARVEQGKTKSAVKVDSGMGRLGLSLSELESAIQDSLLEKAGVDWVLSHLACADQPEHPLNQQQLDRFVEIKSLISAQLPHLKYSLCNSAGCALGEGYHFDLVRPGVGLYGSPAHGALSTGIKPVVGLDLDVIQVRDVPAGAPIGYGATSVSNTSRLIAVVAGGYADGISRSLSNRGFGYVNGVQVPIAGRVSMDSTMFDVSSVSELFEVGPFPKIELLGESQGVDQLALAADTVGYEILTSLGERFERVYVD